MPNIKTALIEATQSLLQRSPSPRLDTELLLSHVLGIPKIKLFSEWNRELDSGQLDRFQRLIERRMAHEPVAYLVGRREFYGRDFRVEPAVLIPRPDTELLIEKALELAGGTKKLRVLDLGTGSGCIAVTLAAEFRARGVEVSCVAVDSSAAALVVAAANARALAVDDFIEFKCTEWFSGLEGSFDLLVANPPYIAVGDKSVGKELKFEPAPALFSGADGLDAIRDILAQAYRFMHPGSWLLIECGSGQHGPIGELFLGSDWGENYSSPRFFNDLAGHERLVVVECAANTNATAE